MLKITIPGFDREAFQGKLNAEIDRIQQMAPLPSPKNRMPSRIGFKKKPKKYLPSPKSVKETAQLMLAKDLPSLKEKIRSLLEAPVVGYCLRICWGLYKLPKLMVLITRLDEGKIEWSEHYTQIHRHNMLENQVKEQAEAIDTLERRLAELQEKLQKHTIEGS